MPDDKRPIVLPPDEPREALRWTCQEYEGVEIHLYSGTPPLRDDDGWLGLEPIFVKDAIKVGSKVLVHGFYGDLFLMTVEQDEDGNYAAVSEKEDGTRGDLMGLLAFGEDDRKCWVCTGLVNLRGVTKLEISSSESE